MAATETAARKRGTPKNASKRATRRRTARKQYPQEVRDAVKRAKAIAGTAMAPGPKQHVAVRKAMGDTPVEELTGMNLDQLRAFAGGKKLDRDATAKLREFGTRVGDPFAKGRALASIIVAAREEAPVAAAGEGDGS